MTPFVDQFFCTRCGAPLQAEGTALFCPCCAVAERLMETVPLRNMPFKVLWSSTPVSKIKEEFEV